ncbi:hypothetical protein SLEP1_g31135 [Rubroshorea leprosula]|uniref:AAA+ ATPase domain-containing protein n=1 Tax=Rubroshorea leprosula TaxID=152421 RepID=A0AAV5K9Z9_9ROSI|nr:hypothetical protein SLEP1_g31135 [Rubroshorea leprosula]
MIKSIFPIPTTTTQIPSTKTILSAAASVAATAVLVRSVAKDYLPQELRDYVYLKLKTFLASCSSEITLVIEEYDGLKQNHLYKAAELYLVQTIPPSAKRIRVSIPKKEDKISVSLGDREEIVENFHGVQLKWKFALKKVPLKRMPSSDPYEFSFLSEVRKFELRFHKKHQKMVLETYLHHILKKAEELQEKKKTLKLFTLRNDRTYPTRDMWQSVNLDHPATFDTLAMESELKKMIMEDLERFVKRKEFYRRVGKAWKRGYLLFGPPGTGKSSLIAAMANYLNFDIYDLELTDVRTNSQLRKLMISTGNKSILVVEDIDCSIELHNRRAERRKAKMAAASAPKHYDEEPKPQVTLSGLLNFVDGLWSSCGDERIIVFTTNHKDKLDPALLRPGRMDMHVHMSYCTPCSFKLLASNYLGITEHPLFLSIEELLEIKKVTPAEVGEQLMKDEVPEVALRGLIEFLENKHGEGHEEGSEVASVVGDKVGEARMHTKIRIG